MESRHQFLTKLNNLYNDSNVLFNKPTNVRLESQLVQIVLQNFTRMIGIIDALESRWLDKIDQLAIINKWDNKTTIYHMQSRLTGFAKIWYNSLDNYNHS